MKTYLTAALAALALVALPACSGGDGNSGAGKSAASKLAKLEPAEARQKLMESGYPINQSGFRQAVDYLDADAVGLFIAAGFDTNAMADALSWPVEGTQRYHNPKFPAQLETSYTAPSYRTILATMFENGLTPNEPIFSIGASKFASRYTSSVFAEALRIGDDDFISFLRTFESDWDTRPGCYQHNPRCRNTGTMSGWLFYAPVRTEVWSLEAAFDAYERLKALGIAQPAAGEDSDPYLMAVIAYRKHLWSRDNADVDALWQAAGSPRPVLPYGTSIEEAARKADPDKVMFTATGSQGAYLVDKVFPCIADNGGDYYACLESPPEED